MLPPNVCVILLSATVPKPEEFADWLGMTYQKKVYVITTPRRPVPLNHFLYTGTDGKTRDNKYAILNDNQWCMEGYVGIIWPRIVFLNFISENYFFHSN